MAEDLALYVPRTLERRTPAAATTELSWTTPNKPMVASWSAAEAIRLAYYANVFVYAAVRAIAEDVAALAFRVGPDPERPEEYDKGHPLAQLLGPAPGGPNRTTDAETFLAWSIVQWIVTGKLGWEIEPDDRGRPVALWPLVASMLDAIPTVGRSPQWFSRFEYGKPGEKTKLAYEDVFYHWSPSADDWRQPESALQAARLDVSVAVMQDRYDYAFLRNDARPAALIVHERFEKVGERNAFRAQFTAEHQGPDNAGKPAFVEWQGDGANATSAIDVKVLGLSARDGQFLERYDAKLRSILVGLGVPMSRLMDASKRTFSNADAEIGTYWRSTVLPRARSLAAAINGQLAPRFDNRNVGWFDTDDVECLQEPSRISSVGPGLVPLVTAGIITEDEARAELGLSPLPEAPAVEPAVVEPPALPPAPPEPPPAPEPRAIVEVEVRAATVEELRARRQRAYTVVNAKATAMERTWTRMMAALFERQGRAVLANLASKRGRRSLAVEQRTDVNPDNIFDRAYWSEETRATAESLYELVVAAGAGHVGDLLGVSFDVADSWAQEFIQARSNQLAGQVTDTTYQAVKDAMSAGTVEGEGIPEIADRIRQVFTDASRQRATTIARTEVISAYNGSASTFAATLGPDVVAAQEWVATNDSRTRDAHAEADGQVALIGTPFEVGGAQMAYPGDPVGGAHNTVNCRCTLLLLTPEEIADRGLTPVVPLSTARAILWAVSGSPFDEIEQRVRAAVRRAA